MLTVGSVFSGIGLLDYGLHLAGIRHLWFCERDEWRRGILARRWPGARVLDDVRRVGRDLPRVGLLAGGFPCKGASSAGKQEGFGHPETVLWFEMARAVRELRPRYVLVENVANILSLHDGAVWGQVLGDLAALGYGVVWDCIPAAAIGAPHLRDRVFAVAAHADGSHQERHAGLRGVADGWTDARGGSGGAVADSQSIGASHTGCDAGERDVRGDAAVRDREAATDASRDAEGGAGSSPGAERERARTRAVDWGEYQPAIARWERVHGPAPAPLVERFRGVDDRRAARVERSRLSALGDGVQVQVGRIAGEYIIGLERGRLAHAA